MLAIAAKSGGHLCLHQWEVGAGLMFHVFAVICNWSSTKSGKFQSITSSNRNSEQFNKSAAVTTCLSRFELVREPKPVGNPPSIITITIDHCDRGQVISEADGPDTMTSSLREGSSLILTECVTQQKHSLTHTHTITLSLSLSDRSTALYLDPCSAEQQLHYRLLWVTMVMRDVHPGGQNTLAHGHTLQ